MNTQAILVEDNAKTGAVVTQLMGEFAGVDVVATAASVAEALRLSQSTEWQLMVLDLSLPDGSGFSVLEALLERGDRRIVVLTGDASTATRERCAALGADAVFCKASELDAFIDFCLGYSSVWGLLS